MKHRVRASNNLSFVKDNTDSFRGYILQGDVIKLDVLGINSDGSLDVYAFRPIPELKIEVNRLYCFAADLKSFTPY